MRPVDVNHVVRGQYEGYRTEPGVAKDSQTETFVALRAEIDNWRWAGVPFALRTGKSLAAGRQVVTIGFHEPVLRMFPLHVHSGASRRLNEIIIDFADPGSISTNFLVKEPGPELTLSPATMTFRYADSFSIKRDLEGYERLLLDAMNGDQSLFTTADGLERLWEISTPLLEHPPPIEFYAPGSWGPDSVSSIAAPYAWHLPD
jgi:glucose-6-phosphate 1-dehydrogenase